MQAQHPAARGNVQTRAGCVVRSTAFSSVVPSLNRCRSEIGKPFVIKCVYGCSTVMFNVYLGVLLYRMLRGDCSFFLFMFMFHIVKDIPSVLSACDVSLSMYMPFFLSSLALGMVVFCLFPRHIVSPSASASSLHALARAPLLPFLNTSVDGEIIYNNNNNNNRQVFRIPTSLAPSTRVSQATRQPPSGT